MSRRSLLVGDVHADRLRRASTCRLHPPAAGGARHGLFLAAGRMRQMSWPSRVALGGYSTFEAGPDHEIPMYVGSSSGGCKQTS